jgi:hypothetical protein
MEERVNRRPYRCQAELMAEHAGIFLSEAQILAYGEKQRLVCTREYIKKHGSPPSDQRILESLLDPEQAATFREAFPNIFSPKKRS